MKTSLNFDLDPEIAQILGQIRRIRNLDIGLQELLEPGVSSFELRRQARSHYRAYRALRLSAIAEQRREHLEYEWRKKETRRIEQLIRTVAKDVDLFNDPDNDDGGQTRDQILFYQVDFSNLVGFDDERLRQAFRNKRLYLYLDDTRNDVRPPDFWERTIERFCVPEV